MDTVKEILLFFQSIGIENDSIFIIIVGIVVAYLIQLMHKKFTKHFTKQEKLFEKMSTSIDTLVEQQKIFSARCNQCDHIHLAAGTEATVWRETAKERLDNLEDHIKEIKKQLLFK